MSVADAAITVLREAGHPMSVAEIYAAILAKNLYTFKAKQPVLVLHQQLRRHCQGVDSAAASKVKYFSSSGPGQFGLLP